MSLLSWLLGENEPAVAQAANGTPPWLATMRAITGTLEKPGSADNPVILAWAKEIGDRFPDMRAYAAQYTHDSIPWCGLTVGYCMARNGIRPVFEPGDTGKFLWAQAWKKFGLPVVGPAQPGDVLVLAGHVTLCDGEDGDYYIGRGGNQSDQVKVSRYAKSAVQAIRRPSGQPVSSPRAPGPVGKPRFTNITATVFGGSKDPNNSAYDGHFITDTELGVALPYRFKGPTPKVLVHRGDRSVLCNVCDVGPWNVADPYWDTHTRPQAESGRDQRGRKTNHAGIDLTPAAAKRLGIDGLGVVEWEFV